MNDLGLIIFLLAAVLSVSWIVGIRKSAKDGGVTRQTVITSMLFNFFTIYALFADEVWAFNLLWLFPLSWFVGTLSLAFPLSLLWIPGSVYAKIITFGSGQKTASLSDLSKKTNQLTTTILEYIGRLSKEAANDIALTVEKEHKKLTDNQKEKILHVVQFWFLVDAGRILVERDLGEQIAHKLNQLLNSDYQKHMKGFQKFAKGETPSISDNPMGYIGIEVSKIAMDKVDPIISMHAVITFTSYVQVFPEGLLKIIGND